MQWVRKCLSRASLDVYIGKVGGGFFFSFPLSYCHMFRVAISFINYRVQVKILALTVKFSLIQTSLTSSCNLYTKRHKKMPLHSGGGRGGVAFFFLRVSPFTPGVLDVHFGKNEGFRWRRHN